MAIQRYTVFEEESQTRYFSIHHLARYCLDTSELFKTESVVPVVIFLQKSAHANKEAATRQRRRCLPGIKMVLINTDPALIKMLSIHHRHQFSEYIKQLNIVPVAISYEYDPCDILKAQELYTLECTGQYQKSENEDLHSNGVISEPILIGVSILFLNICKRIG